MQASQALHAERSGGGGFSVLGILIEDSSGQPPTAADLRTWAKAYSVTFPVLGDPDKSAFKTFIPRGVLPAYLVIDREGIVRYRAVGAADDPAAEDKLKAALDAAGAPAPMSLPAGSDG